MTTQWFYVSLIYDSNNATRWTDRKPTVRDDYCLHIWGQMRENKAALLILASSLLSGSHVWLLADLARLWLEWVGSKHLSFSGRLAWERSRGGGRCAGAWADLCTCFLSLLLHSPFPRLVDQSPLPLGWSRVTRWGKTFCIFGEELHSCVVKDVNTWRKNKDGH